MRVLNKIFSRKNLIIALFVAFMIAFSAFVVSLPSTSLKADEPSFTASEGDASLANDGNMGTKWEASGKSGSLVYDLGEIKIVSSYAQYFDRDDVWYFSVLGSVDGTNWAILADYNYGAGGQNFSDSITGYYRYVKLEIKDSRTHEKANSREFIVVSKDLSSGTNIALGLKGYSDAWSAGFEHESAFDGNSGSYYCAPNGDYPHNCGVKWNYTVSVKSIEIWMQDYGAYDFEVVGIKADNSQVTLASRLSRTGTYFNFEVSGEFVDIVYKVYAGPGWASLQEMVVNGFKNLASDNCFYKASKSTSGSDTIYTFDSETYVDTVVNGGTVSYTVDGNNWQTATNGKVEKVVKAVKTSQSASAVYGFGIQRDLAQGIKGVVDGYTEENYDATKATTNPEHEDDKNLFWCAPNYGGEHWLQLDLGRLCIVEKVVQTFQDEANYKLKLLVSKDAENWVTIFSEYENTVHGKTFTGVVTGADKLYRYVKLIVTYEGWANSNQLQVIGYGSPQAEEWWERESGVIRYYPKEQKVSVDEIINNLDFYRENGFQVLEIHQPYEGYGDIWSGLGATNNYQGDPVNGSLDDWNRLLEEAHARNIYVFMFGNVGYARCSAEFFKKACQDYANGIKSAEAGWFLFSSSCPDAGRWFWNDIANAYVYGFWGENGEIPTYNFDNPEWRAECERYLTFWADFGFDGVALDAPNVYYFGSTNPEWATYNSITKPLRKYNIMLLPEGTGDANFIYSYYYTTIQNYNIDNWGGGAYSVGIDAMTDHSAVGIDDKIKSGRDNAVSYGGVVHSPLSFEQKYENVEDYKRMAETALITTSGHMAFLHAGSSGFVGQDIMKTWNESLVDEVHRLFKLQNSFGAFNATGMRFKLNTNNDNLYYAYAKADALSNVRAITVLNYSGADATITVQVANSGFGDVLTDLKTGKMYFVKNGTLTVQLGIGEYISLGQFNGVENTNATYTEPEKIQEVMADYSEPEADTNVSKQGVRLVTSNSTNVAVAHFSAEYTDKGIILYSDVVDNDVFDHVYYSIGYDDNVEYVINVLNRSQSGWNTSTTFHFLITSAGKYYFQRANSSNGWGADRALDLNCVYGDNFYCSAEYTDYGYKTSVFLGYDLLNTNYANGYGNISVCPAMRNTHDYADTTWKSYSENGVNWSNVSSFIHITSDGKYNVADNKTQTEVLFIGDESIGNNWFTKDTDMKGITCNYLQASNITAKHWHDNANTLKGYNPSNVVLFIGGKDVKELSAPKAMASIARLINDAHAIFPNAKIFVTSVVATVGVDFIKATQVNNAIKQYCNANSFATYIALSEAISSSTEVNKTYLTAGRVTINQLGYNIWLDLLFKALGKNKGTSDILGDGVNYYGSPSITQTQNVIILDGTHDQYAYFKNGGDNEFFAQVEINAEMVYKNDAYPKFGLVLTTETESLFFYIDGSANLTTKKVGRVYYRNNDSWDWGTSQEIETDISYTGANKTLLAMLRYNGNIVLMVNGEVAFTIADAYNTKCDIGILSFNTKVNLTNAVYTTENLQSYVK